MFSAHAETSNIYIKALDERPSKMFLERKFQIRCNRQKLNKYFNTTFFDKYCFYRYILF